MPLIVFTVFAYFALKLWLEAMVPLALILAAVAMLIALLNILAED
jgi:hypothetical protein